MTMPMITEKEAVERERVAWVKSAHAHAGNFDSAAANCVYVGEAARVYPLPKVKRPRVVRDVELDSAAEFRVYEGRLEARGREDGSRWGTERLRGWKLDIRTVRFFADLLANPTELVDVTEP